MGRFATINFKRWISDNRRYLQPPVGNKLVWEDRELMVMVVGGPNSRTDYHIDPGEELFYQIEGDMTLRLIDDSGPVDFPIREGEMFLLPPMVPHSPQRPANSIGLVIERKRHAGELDGFVWYCQNCGEKLYEETFQLDNIVKQFQPIFDRFFQDAQLSVCRKCGTKMRRPDVKADAKD